MSDKRPTYGVSEAIFLHDLTDAQRRIYDFCAAVRRDQPVNSELLEHIVGAFERHMMGEAKTLDEAFGLKRGRGAIKKRSLKEHAYRVELAMAVLVAKEQAPERTLPLIFDDLVELYTEKASHIQDCYEEHRKEAVQALADLRLIAQDPVGAAIAMYHDVMKQGGEAPFGGARSVNWPKNLPRK